MADEEEWDPGLKRRTKDMLKRWKDMLDPRAISVFLFPNKDD